MSYTHEEVQKIYNDLTEESRVWKECTEHWKKHAEAALKVLRDLEWGPRVMHAGICYQCPSCYAWKKGGHADDCSLSAVLTTGRRQQPAGSSESETVEGEVETVWKPKWPVIVGEPEVVVSWSSYDELLTQYLRLARERLLVNVLCVVSFMVALTVLAVQVYSVLGRGY